MKSEQESVRVLFIRLMRAPPQTFPRAREKLHAPDKQGVYVIHGPRERVLHVGRTPKARRGIAQRLRDHMCAASSFTNQYLEGDGARCRSRARAQLAG